MNCIQWLGFIISKDDPVATLRVFQPHLIMISQPPPLLFSLSSKPPGIIPSEDQLHRAWDYIVLNLPCPSARADDDDMRREIRADTPRAFTGADDISSNRSGKTTGLRTVRCAERAWTPCGNLRHSLASAVMYRARPGDLCSRPTRFVSVAGCRSVF